MPKSLLQQSDLFCLRLSAVQREPLRFRVLTLQSILRQWCILTRRRTLWAESMSSKKLLRETDFSDFTKATLPCFCSLCPRTLYASAHTPTFRKTSSLNAIAKTTSYLASVSVQLKLFSLLLLRRRLKQSWFMINFRLSLNSGTSFMVSTPSSSSKVFLDVTKVLYLRS